MTRLELEINPFTRRVVANGIHKKDRELHTFFVEFWHHEQTIEFFNERFAVFIRYDKRLEADCFRLDDTGMLLDEPVLTKVKIITTDNESTFI